MQTEFTRNSPEAVELWAKRLWIEMPRVIEFGKYMKENTIETFIEMKKDLEGGPGDKLTFTLASKLEGQGVSGDDDLEGQEEQMDVFSDDVTLDQRRNAIRLKGRLSEKRTAFDQADTAKTLLKTWLAEVIDDDIFTQFDSSPTTVVYGGSAGAVNQLTATDLITPGRIDAAVAKAKKADPKIWPVKSDSGRYYVLIIHPDVGFDLRNNSVWQGYQQNGAQIAGDKNPIFSGMFGLYNSVVISEHEKVAVATNGGSGGTVPWASNMFLGRQAGLFAWGRKPDAWEKEFNYGNSRGFAIGAIWDFTKAVFDGADYAYIALRTARTNN